MALLTVLLALASGMQQLASAQGLFDTTTQIACVATAGASTRAPIIYNGNAPVRPIFTHFALRRLVGRGTVDANFAVVSYDYDWDAPAQIRAELAHSHPAVPFQQGKTYLLSLTRAPKFLTEQPGLLHLASQRSLLRLAEVLPAARPSDSSPRAILRILLASLVDTSPDVRADAVRGLASYGPFLWDYASYPNLANSSAGTLCQVPDRADIIRSLKGNVIPSLTRSLRHLGAADTPTQIALLTGLGYLQDVDVLPDIISVSAKDPPGRSPLYALGTYEVPAALPALSKGFLNANPDVAAQCMNSVITSRDSRAVPALVAALLHNPNGSARYTAAYALREITGVGMGGDYGPADFPAHEKEADQFWQDWLAQNKK